MKLLSVIRGSPTRVLLALWVVLSVGGGLVFVRERQARQLAVERQERKRLRELAKTLDAQDPMGRLSNRISEINRRIKEMDRQSDR